MEKRKEIPYLNDRNDGGADNIEVVAVPDSLSISRQFN